VIHDVDEALRALVEGEALTGSGVEVSFDAPTKAWAAARTAPVVDVYLFDIREDTDRRVVQYEEVRAENGGRSTVVERRMPPRMFALSYLVTAWTQRPEDEHRLLGALLGAFLRNPVLPGVEGVTAPMRMTVAQPGGNERASSEVWNALGGELKPSLEIVVTTPVDPHRKQEVGPLVTQGPVLRAEGAGTVDVRQRRLAAAEDAAT
jgi:Pvc16 N-terminal domain